MAINRLFLSQLSQAMKQNKNKKESDICTIKKRNKVGKKERKKEIERKISIIFIIHRRWLRGLNSYANQLTSDNCA